MPNTVTKSLGAAKQLGDLVRNMYNPGYCMQSAVITSPAGAVATPNVSLLGQPVKAGAGTKLILVLAADIANATGVIADDNFHDLPVAGADIGYPIQVLKRGPANYGAEALAALDVLGAAINAANFATALANPTNVNPPLIPQGAFATTKTQTN